MSCTHPEWKEVRRSWCPPPANYSDDGGTGEAILEHRRFMAFGCTSVELQCIACLDLKNVILIGKVYEP